MPMAVALTTETATPTARGTAARRRTVMKTPTTWQRALATLVARTTAASVEILEKLRGEAHGDMAWNARAVFGHFEEFDSYLEIS